MSERVLVTGSSSGIGFATAKLLRTQGYSVIMHGIEESEVVRAVQELDDGTGRLASFFGDLSLPETSENAHSVAISHFGGLDHLVCSAGIQTYGTAETPPEDDLLRAVNVNLMGTFHIIQASIEAIRSSRGTITVVSSSQAARTQENVVGYTTSKAALNGMVRALAVDEAKFGVRVNAVLPGAINTPMLRESARVFGTTSVEKTVHDWGLAHPLGSVGEAEDVAHVCAFLLSDKARFITGSEIFVDGGLTIRSGVTLRE